MARLVAGLARLNVDINIYVYAFDAELVIVNLRYIIHILVLFKFLHHCTTCNFLGTVCNIIGEKYLL